MPYLRVRHKVDDYDKWYEVFASHSVAQEESGLADLQLSRDASDPNTVTVFFRVTDFVKARAFTETPGAHEAAEKGGIIGEPEVLWLDEL